MRHVQQVLSSFIYRDGPCGQRRVQRLFAVTVISSVLLKAVQAVGLPVDLSQLRSGFGALSN